MARDNPTPTFRIIPATSHYSGLTALTLSPKREIVAMGVGRDVERVLMEVARGR